MSVYIAELIEGKVYRINPVGLVRETDKAWLFSLLCSDGTEPVTVQAWFPKSQVNVEDDFTTVIIPEWLLTAKQEEVYPLQLNVSITKIDPNDGWTPPVDSDDPNYYNPWECSGM